MKIPTSEKDLLMFLHYYAYRFMGYIPDDKITLNCLADFWREDQHKGEDDDPVTTEPRAE